MHRFYTQLHVSLKSIKKANVPPLFFLFSLTLFKNFASNVPLFGQISLCPAYVAIRLGLYLVSELDRTYWRSSSCQTFNSRFETNVQHE